MKHALVIRGLPRSLERDAWWFTDADAPMGGGPGGQGEVATSPIPRRSLGAALGLVVLAGDFLLFGHAPGVSAALFTAVLFAACITVGPGWRGAAGPAALMLICALPAVEHLQALSVAFLLAGLLVASGWAALAPRAGAAQVLRAAEGLARAVLLGGALAAKRALRARGKTGRLGAPRRAFRNWAFPVGGALVLCALLADANPVFEAWLAQAPDVRGGAILRRAAFWVGLGLLVWPLLAPPVDTPATAWRGVDVGLNAGSVANALIVFNLVLGLQTLTDLRYLWAGGALPEGLTYAAYAQRGAYPLLATAMLAGGFALAARPWLDARRGLRALMLLWLGQNVLLTASAAHRLALYVDAFGLTHLRAHAGVWMGLVAAALVLTGWWIMRSRTTAWLVARCAGICIATLYVCAFVNFAGVIAAHNLERAERTDWRHMCDLGAMASAETAAVGLTGDCFNRPPQIDGWRDWGFRKWRVRRTLARIKQAGAPE